MSEYNYYKGAIFLADNSRVKHIASDLEGRYSFLSFYSLPPRTQFHSESYRMWAQLLEGDSRFSTRIASVTAPNNNLAEDRFSEVANSTLFVKFFGLELNELLRIARVSAGLRRIADIPGLPAATGSNVESSVLTVPHHRTLIAYAQACNLDPSLLARARQQLRDRS